MMALKLDDDVEEYVLDIMEYLEYMEDEEIILDKINEANQEFPEHLLLWNYLTALYLYRKQKLGHAYVILKKIHDDGYQHAETIYALAVIMATLGLSDEAIYYIKLSSTMEESNKDLIPNWMPKFENAFFMRDSTELIDAISYLMKRGYYKTAYLQCYDLSLAFTSHIKIFIMMIRLSLFNNLPHDAIHFVEKIIDYYQGTLTSVESLLMSDLFLYLRDEKNLSLWLEDAIKNFDSQNFSAHEQRLLFRQDPAYHAIASYYRLNIVDKKRELEQEYSKAQLAPKPYDRQKQNKDLKLGVFISSYSQSEHRLNYLATKLLFFRNTNLSVYFYFDRERYFDDYSKYGNFTEEIFYTGRIDNETLAEIIHRDEIDILLDINDYAMPSRIDFWRKKPAFLNILYAGDDETAHLWGYDAVLGDQYLYPLTKGQVFDKGEAIIEHQADKATILRMRFPLLQYWANNQLINSEVPEKTAFIVGIYAKRIDLDDDKIKMLHKLLQQDTQIMLMFEVDMLGGEVMFQEIIELIAGDDKNLQERIMSVDYHLTLGTFILYPDIMLNLSHSNIDLVQKCLLNQRICLCYQGILPSERVDGSILLAFDENFQDKLVFDNWSDYYQAIIDMVQDDDKITHYKKMIASVDIENKEKLSENIVLTYDDLKFITNNFFEQKP
ncbi:MAG: hypothetical protein K0U39_04100 [Alphaproteobacteria bacterium]|nr:hypothetical protein [Alphaproteobacteria bacterium]